MTTTDRDGSYDDLPSGLAERRQDTAFRDRLQTRIREDAVVLDRLAAPADATWHALKVQPPYFDALFDGSKTFEVRRNDRAFQRGDMLRLREWDSTRDLSHRDCDPNECRRAWLTGRECVRAVTFVYSGDPRFGDWPTGLVVLGLGNPNDAEALAHSWERAYQAEAAKFQAETRTTSFLARRLREDDPSCDAEDCPAHGEIIVVNHEADERAWLCRDHGEATT